MAILHSDIIGTILLTPLSNIISTSALLTLIKNIPDYPAMVIVVYTVFLQFVEHFAEMVYSISKNIMASLMLLSYGIYSIRFYKTWLVVLNVLTANAPIVMFNVFRLFLSYEVKYNFDDICLFSEFRVLFVAIILVVTGLTYICVYLLYFE